MNPSITRTPQSAPQHTSQPCSVAGHPPREALPQVRLPLPCSQELTAGSHALGVRGQRSTSAPAPCYPGAHSRSGRSGASAEPVRPSFPVPAPAMTDMASLGDNGSDVVLCHHFPRGLGRGLWAARGKRAIPAAPFQSVPWGLCVPPSAQSHPIQYLQLLRTRTIATPAVHSAQGPGASPPESGCHLRLRGQWAGLRASPARVLGEDLGAALGCGEGSNLHKRGRNSDAWCPELNPAATISGTQENLASALPKTQHRVADSCSL